VIYPKYSHNKPNKPAATHDLYRLKLGSQGFGTISVIMLIFLTILVGYCITINASCRSGDFLYLLTLFSGRCAELHDQQFIYDDMRVTIEFFETQFNRYSKNPVIVCKLIFALQSIQDYHGPAEYAFRSIERETLKDQVYVEYDKVINSKVTLLGDESICIGVRVCPQSNTHSSNDDGNGPDHGAESELHDTIHNWLSSVYILSPAEGKFQHYKIMKVAILQHAVSLGIRGEDSRNRWRYFAAASMTKLPFDRFVVCEAIKLSLLLRRQNAIRNVDTKRARDQLNGLWREMFWTHSISENREKSGLAQHLQHIINCYTRINYIRKYYTQLLTKIQCYKRVTHEVT
jgi:hypothetical protein